MLKTATKQQIQIYKSMSFEQKLLELDHLRETAWAIKLAGYKMQHPEWDDKTAQEATRKCFLYATT